MTETIVNEIFQGAFATVSGAVTTNLPIILAVAGGLFGLGLVWGLAKRYLRGRSA